MASVARVRCYQCGRKNVEDAESCVRCGAAFLALCECGAGVGVFADACSSCGENQLPRSFPARRRPLVRLLVALPFIAAAVGAVYVALRPPQESAWRLKADAKAAMDTGDMEEAVRLYRRAIVVRPDDAQARYNLGVCFEQLGFPETTFLEEVRQALQLDPQLVEARLFLASIYYYRHDRLDRALEETSRAVTIPAAPGKAHRMHAELELKRPQPDLALALHHLEQARRLEDPVPGLDLLIIRTQLRMLGSTSPERYPPGFRNALEDLSTKLEQRRPDPGTEELLAAARAEVHLGLQRNERAYTIAESALQGLAPDADPSLRARLLILRGQAMLGIGNLDAALSDFEAALRARPESENAGRIATLLMGEGHVERLENLLTQVARTRDPQGQLNAVLAAVFLVQGRIDEARNAAAAALRYSPRDALFTLLEGDIERAAGKRDEARTAYETAQAIAPGLVAPQLRLAMMALDEGGDEEQRERRLRDTAAELESLLVRHAGNPAVYLSLATFQLELAEPAKAEQTLSEALRRARGDERLWVLMGDALRASPQPEALTRAAGAYRQARALRPTDPAIAMREGLAWLDAGKADQALVAVEGLLRASPDAQPAIELRARANRRLGHWPKVVADLRLLRKLGDSRSSTVLSLVDAEFRARRGTEARALIESVRSEGDPALLDALETIAMLHDGGIDAAITKLERAGPTTGLAQLYFRAGRLDAAIDVLERLHASDPDDDRVAVMLVLALLDRSPPTAEAIARAKAVTATMPVPGIPGRRQLARGRIALAEGEHQQAVEVLRTAAAHLPTSSLVKFYLGEALMRSGARAEGLATLRQAVQLPDRLPQMMFIVAARVLEESHRTADADLAEQLAAEARRLDPTSTAAAARLCHLLGLRNEYRSLANVADEMLQLEGLPPDVARRFRYDALFARVSLGELGTASVHLEALPAEDQDSVLGRTLRGVILVDRGDHAEGERLLLEVLGTGGNRVAAVALGTSFVTRGAFAEASKLGDAWRESNPPEHDIGLVLARMLRHAHEVDRALAQARGVLAKRPDSIPAAREATLLLSRTDDDAAAIALAREVVAATPEKRRWEAQVFLGRTLLVHAGDGEEAARIAADVAATAPTAFARRSAKLLGAEAMVVTGRFGEAERVLGEVTADWVKDLPVSLDDVLLEARVRFCRGSIAIAGGYFSTAVGEFTRCLVLDPDNDTVRNNLAWSLLHTSDGVSQGHRLARGLTERVPGNPDYWDTRGVAAVKAGQAADAESSLKKAMDLYAKQGPKRRAARGETHLSLARMLRSGGRHAEAADAAREVLEYAGDTPAAVAARKFLNSGEGSRR